MSEWTKCSVMSAGPARREFIVPRDYQQEHAFLSMYKGKTGTRAIPKLPGVPRTQPSANGHSNANGSSISALQPLKNMKFVLSGKMDKEKYQGKIEALGGNVVNSVSKETIALISDKGKSIFIIIECKTLQSIYYICVAHCCQVLRSGPS